jgi:hypothetical protein
MELPLRARYVVGLRRESEPVGFARLVRRFLPTRYATATASPTCTSAEPTDIRA